MIVATILTLLAVALAGSVPLWPYSRGWGRSPSIGIALLLAIVGILYWLDVI